MQKKDTNRDNEIMNTALLESKLIISIDSKLKEIRIDIYVICLFLGIMIGLQIIVLLGLIFGFRWKKYSHSKNCNNYISTDRYN